MTSIYTPETVGIDLHNAWLEVNDRALSANAALVRRYLDETSSGKSPRLMAVVKANGYGVGAIIAARAFESGGADWFGVTTITEAKKLLEGGVDVFKTPILVFAPTITPDQARFAVEHSLHVTVCDSGHVDLMLSAAAAAGLTAHLHLKLDTGMGRLGLSPAGAFDVARKIDAAEHAYLAGVYTHFANAYERDLNSAKKQLGVFTTFCRQLNDVGISGFVKHCANTGALLQLPESRFDLVRAGNLLYGTTPSHFKPSSLSTLRSDIAGLKARVIFVHDLSPGSTVGYGSEFVTKRPTRAAVIPIGFADGFTMQPASVTNGIRGLKSLIAALTGRSRLGASFGKFFAPVLGRVAMQMIVVDVTDSPQPINVGDIASIRTRRLALSPALPRIKSSGPFQ